MAKRTHNHVALEDVETKAQEFISLAFELCEQELREHRQNQTESAVHMRKALQFSMLSVLNSIKAFQAIVQIKDAIKEFGRVDVLVNCAGIGIIEDAEKMPVESWDKTMSVNLRGAFLVAQHVGREMIAGGNGGKIINIASQGALVALDKHIAYNSSKSGLLGLTQVLAYEWAEFDIQVNAISPTVILTELGKRSWAGEVGENFKKKIPARRFGYPDEVAAAAVYLASDAANLVTGANLIIDGGYTIQ